MPIEVDTNFNFERILGDKLKGAGRELDKQMQVETTRIKTRTLSGRDSKNRGFKKYAPGTVASKRRRGVSNPRKVKLQDSGDMLNSLTFLGIELIGKKIIAQMGFLGRSGKGPSAAEKVVLNEALGRKFFGLTKDQQQRIRKAVSLGLGSKNV